MNQRLHRWIRIPVLALIASGAGATGVLADDAKAVTILCGADEYTERDPAETIIPNPNTQVDVDGVALWTGTLGRDEVFVDPTAGVRTRIALLDGDDYFCGGPLRDLVFGGHGNDELYGEGAGDKLFGEEDSDFLSGGDGNDKLRGAGANDVITGDDGDDKIWGGAGADTLSGGLGDDVIRGNQDPDWLEGGIGGVELAGKPKVVAAPPFVAEDGDDRLLGGSGADVLLGGMGSDIIKGHGGDDFIFGGFALELATAGSARTIPQDLVAYDDGFDTDGDGFADTFDDGDELLAGGPGADVIWGDLGDDTLLGGADADVLNGGLGDDLIKGQFGTDHLDGGGGDDLLNCGGNDLVISWFDLAFGGEGADTSIGCESTSGIEVILP